MLHPHIPCPFYATKGLFIEGIHRVQAANTVNTQPTCKTSGKHTGSTIHDIVQTVRYLIVGYIVMITMCLKVRMLDNKFNIRTYALHKSTFRL